jgi:plasmid stabilization system protein ParE
MKKYTVTFHPGAEQDIRTSYDWGCRVWGKTKAKQWVRELRAGITKRLAVFQESCPLAPESEELGIPIRQMIVGRYRVLFTIRARNVYILHVRGAYSSEVASEESE